MDTLPDQLAGDLGPLPEALAERGFRVDSFTHTASFGNFEVLFVGRGTSFSIVRDRGQFHVDRVHLSELKSAGLWRSFSEVAPLAGLLLAWAEGRRAA